MGARKTTLCARAQRLAVRAVGAEWLDPFGGKVRKDEPRRRGVGHFRVSQWKKSRQRERPDEGSCLHAERRQGGRHVRGSPPARRKTWTCWRASCRWTAAAAGP